MAGPEGAAIVADTCTIPALRDETVIGTIEYELVLNGAHDPLMTHRVSIDDEVMEMSAGDAEVD